MLVVSQPSCRGSESDRCGVLAFVAPDSGLPGRMKSSCTPNSYAHASIAGLQKFCPVVHGEAVMAHSREPSSLQRRVNTGVKIGCWVVTEQKIHLRTQAPSGETHKLKVAVTKVASKGRTHKQRR
jgi:hypothetical protein